MACKIGPEFLCTSINNLRVAEDSISALLALVIIGLLFFATYRIVREGPLARGLIGLTLAFIPFFLWKLAGAYKRIFLDASNPLYGTLDTFGEIMEAFSALAILVSLIHMYIVLRPKK